jgi:predicted alpha/beta superfamily hydrolase
MATPRSHYGVIIIVINIMKTRNFMQPKLQFRLSFQFLFCLFLISCQKSNGDNPTNPPVIVSLSCHEEGQTSDTISVVQKDILKFQSTNLGNSRTLRILVPEYYDADSVNVRLSIALENDTSVSVNINYALNSENFLPLPVNRIISMPNGINTLKVYAIDSDMQKSNVFTLADISVNTNYKVLYMNDGGDIPSLKFKTILGDLYTDDSIEKIIVVGIDASGNRLNEYGTIDSTGNSVICYSSIGQIGNKAKEYTNFLTEEVMPYINRNYRVKTGPENSSIMGSSVGGLSAFNIAWMKPDLLGKAGVFSGSFWWRENSGLNPTGEQINQARIMHKLVRNSNIRNGMKFWFEAGTNDETDDRDGDGIIDAIDDTKDLMQELKTLGYTENQDFVYVEVAGGQHNQSTWSQVLDDFLIWNYKK